MTICIIAQQFALLHYCIIKHCQATLSFFAHTHIPCSLHHITTYIFLIISLHHMSLHPHHCVISHTHIVMVEEEAKGDEYFTKKFIHFLNSKISGKFKNIHGNLL